MILLAIRDYIKQHDVVDLRQLSSHFQRDPLFLRQMLSHWLEKGVVYRLPVHNETCGVQCRQCRIVSIEKYGYRQS